MMTRRSFLRSLGAWPPAGAATGYYTFEIEPTWLEIVRRPMPIRHLPPGLAGGTVVQLSDLHVSLWGNDDYLPETFRRVADLDPDVVVFTGDLMNPQSRHR